MDTNTSLEKEIKLKPKKEIQAKLIAINKEKSSDSLREMVQSYLEATDLTTSSHSSEMLVDDYYDTDNFDLMSIGSGIRIRSSGQTKYLTYKVSNGEEKIGERSWMETTEDLNQTEEKDIINSNFSKITRKSFPELKGKVFSKKLSLVNNRVSYILERGQEEYTLSIDFYKYTYPKIISAQGEQVEIEIEANNELAIDALSEIKIDLKSTLPFFEYAAGNKYSRGINEQSGSEGKEKSKIASFIEKNKTIIGIATALASITAAILKFFPDS